MKNGIRLFGLTVMMAVNGFTMAAGQAQTKAPIDSSELYTHAEKVMSFSVGGINGNVLFLGPESYSKSTFIKYLLEERDGIKKEGGFTVRFFNLEWVPNNDRPIRTPDNRIYYNEESYGFDDSNNPYKEITRLSVWVYENLHDLFFKLEGQYFVELRNQFDTEYTLLAIYLAGGYFSKYYVSRFYRK
jgi:hypothetical protein